MNVSKSKVEIAEKSLDLLAPFVRTRLEAALAECHDSGYPVAVCETYRSPERQDWLYESGRTRPGKQVTRSRAWQSFHQLSVAADICFADKRKVWWPKSDDPLWDRVHNIFAKYDFEDLTWERAHVQCTAGMSQLEARGLMLRSGIEAVWALIESRLALGNR